MNTEPMYNNVVLDNVLVYQYTSLMLVNTYPVREMAMANKLASTTDFSYSMLPSAQDKYWWYIGQRAHLTIQRS